MNLDPLTIFAQIAALILGLTLHEFAHAYAGFRLGDDTARLQGRLTINPFAHIDPFATLLLPLLLILAGLPVFAAAKPVPFNPWAVRGGKWGAALVAAAGPLTNLFIAVVVAIWMQFIPLSVVSYTFLGSIVIVNVALGIFNLIPLPPLDGSRVLYAAAPAGLRDAMDRLERMGLIVVFAFVLLMAYSPLGAYLGMAIQTVASALLPSSNLP